jgi:Flp pilus assembly protein TadG
MTMSDLKGQGRGCSTSRFLKDQRGVASIEFLFIVPLLLMLMFGAVQFTAGYAAFGKVTVVSRTMSDLISQATSVCTSDIDNALVVGRAIMWPYPNTSMSATISQVYIDPTTHKAAIDWSRGTNERAKGSAVTVPADIATDGRYLIMSEVQYDFTPSVGYNIAEQFKSATFHMSKTSFTAPRQTSLVLYNPSAPCS